VIPALLAFGCAGAAAAYTLALGGRALPVTTLLVPAGLAALVAGIVLRRPAAVPWAVVVLGIAYVLARAGHTTVDGWSAAVGTALLLAAELATWSIDHDPRIHEEAAVLRRRIGILAALAAAALLLDVLLVASAAVAAPAGLLLAAAGVAAAVAAVALVLRLVRHA
jgi:hypothetical protein